MFFIRFLKKIRFFIKVKNIIISKTYFFKDTPNYFNYLEIYDNIHKILKINP